MGYACHCGHDQVYLQERWAVPHAELASAKGCKPGPSGGVETADTAEAQGAAKRYLPFSTGIPSCSTLFSSCCAHHAGAASFDMAGNQVA